MGQVVNGNSVGVVRCVFVCVGRDEEWSGEEYSMAVLATGGVRSL